MNFDGKMKDLSYDEFSLTSILNEYSEPRYYRDEYDEHVSHIVRDTLAEHIAETSAVNAHVNSEMDRAAENYFYEHDARRSFGESTVFSDETAPEYFQSEDRASSIFDGYYNDESEPYEDYTEEDDAIFRMTSQRSEAPHAVEDETLHYDFSEYTEDSYSDYRLKDEHADGYEEEYTESEEFYDEDDDIKIYEDVKIYDPDGDHDVKIYGAPAMDISYGRREYNPADFHADGVEDFRIYETAESSQTDFENFKSEKKAEREKKAKKESRMSGITSLLAMLQLKFQRQRIQSEKAGSKLDEEEDLGPEATPKDASRYYGSQIHSLRSRVRMAAILTIIASWISLGLPVFGALRTDLKTASLVLLIIQLAVIMVGLDVFTAGITAIVRGRPGIWSLLSLTLIVMALDAGVTASMGVKGDGLPYSALGCLCMSLALYSALQQTRALRYSTKALEIIESPYTVTTEADVIEDGRSVLKSQIVTDGFIKTAEAPSFMEELYTKLVFPIIVLAVLLAGFVSLKTDNIEAFIHYLSGILAAGLPFVVFVNFPIGYARLARLLFHQGAAVAGWEGVRDIGRSRHMIVTDSDIFPPSAISIEAVRILDGMWPESIISAAGSIICASGSGLAPAFMDLMQKNNCEKQEVEDFYCHEGGGLTARINGMEVICGSVAFMNLMSVRIPRRMSLDNCVYLAINRTIMGVFTIDYRPLPLVKSALSEIMNVKRQPHFAIRDFLVTPLMIRNKFKISTDGFEFPTFERRYEISSVEPGQDSQVSAVLTREGLGSFILLTERVRKLYVISLVLLVFALVVGLLGMLLLSYYPIVGAFALADVKTLLFYMLLSLIPGIILNIVFMN